MFFHFQINFCSFSSIGNLKIAEIDPGGHFVKILNCAPEKEESIGDYLLKQDVQGQLVAVFQFPPETRMGPNSTVTVSVGGLNAFFQLADEGTLLACWYRVKLKSVFSERLTLTNNDEFRRRY